MASGGQSVTHTGLTVMPASYADNLDWGKGSLRIPKYVSKYSKYVHMINENSNEFPAHKTTKTFSPNFHFCHSFSLHVMLAKG